MSRVIRRATLSRFLVVALVPVMLVLGLLLWSPGSASAQTVVFQDDFNAELILRIVPPLGTSLRSGTDLANWTITAGNVDVVGLDTNSVSFADNFPGNGTYLDMGGTVNGTIDSGPISLSAGTYQLSFKIGNMGGPGNTLNVSLGGLYSESFSPTATSVLTQINRIIVVSTGTTASLVFAEIGQFNDPSGSALDDVLLTLQDPPAPADDGSSDD